MWTNKTGTKVTSNKRAWKVRVDSSAEDITTQLESGEVKLDYGILGLEPAMPRKDIESLVRQSYQGSSEKRISAHIGQIYRILNEFSTNDIVVVPVEKSTKFCVGEIYKDKSQVFGKTLILPIKWLRIDIPKNNFQQDLRYSFMAIMKVCEVKRNNAPSRLYDIAMGKDDPGY